jgi:hypothetical protein
MKRSRFKRGKREEQRKEKKNDNARIDEPTQVAGKP